jgi:CRISPR-associated endonuclease Csn1
VQRAIERIWVSHKPDHGYEAGMMDETTYKPPHLDRLGLWRTRGIEGNNPNERAADAPMIAIRGHQANRHQRNETGEYLPYKGYVGGSNYCIEITRDKNGKWQGEVISTFGAYEIVRKSGLNQLRHPSQGQNGTHLVMRLVIDDVVKMEVDGREQLMRFVKVAASGQIWFAPVHEANVDARNRDKQEPFSYTSKTAGSLHKSKARRVTISPIGELKDPGFPI